MSLCLLLQHLLSFHLSLYPINAKSSLILKTREASTSHSNSTSVCLSLTCTQTDIESDKERHSTSSRKELVLIYTQEHLLLYSGVLEFFFSLTPSSFRHLESSLHSFDGRTQDRSWSQGSILFPSYTLLPVFLTDSRSTLDRTDAGSLHLFVNSKKSFIPHETKSFLLFLRYSKSRTHPNLTDVEVL